MAIDKLRLKQKLERLEKYVKGVTELRSNPKTEYKKISVTEDVAERRLEKAIQQALNIASYIVAEEILGKPEKYKDLFYFLGQAGILDVYLVERLEKMAGFRNVLIHEYSEIDTNRVYQAVHHDIDDLAEFAKVIYKKYLKEK